jgi:integrase
VTIDPVAVSTREGRRDWAIRKSKAIAARRLELEGGAPPETGTTLADALDRYFKDHPDLSAKTVEAYRSVSNKLKAWGKTSGVSSADGLRASHLVAFRGSLLRERSKTRKAGGKRGEQVPTQRARSPHSINRDLRSANTVISYARRLGLLPHVTADQVRDGLQRVRAPLEPPEFLRATEVQKLLEAALRHDAVTFAATRAEHAGKGRPGTTPRYDAVAPLVAFLLLSGMRIGEALAFEWSAVDLEARDSAGNRAGEIRLPPKITKTRMGRTVGLEVSSGLHRMLAAMHLKTGGKGQVFSLTRGQALAAHLRLTSEFGAPKGCNWHALRATTGTFLTSAPGIFGSASAYHSARQLGHSVQVAEAHYVGRVRGISADAKTLESAMGIEVQLTIIVDAIATRSVPERIKMRKKRRALNEHAAGAGE